MGLDIRIPLGLMFLITGGLMAVYGIFTQGSAIYAKSLGMNVNLEWGALMFVFGTIMFWLGKRPQRHPVRAQGSVAQPPRRSGH